MVTFTFNSIHHKLNLMATKSTKLTPSISKSSTKHQSPNDSTSCLPQSLISALKSIKKGTSLQECMRQSKCSSKPLITSIYTMWSKLTQKHKILLSHFTPTPPYQTFILFSRNLLILVTLSWNKMSHSFIQLRTRLPSILSLISCTKRSARKSWSILWVGRFQEVAKLLFKYLSFQQEKWLILLKSISRCSSLIFNPCSSKS